MLEVQRERERCPCMRPHFLVAFPRKHVTNIGFGHAVCIGCARSDAVLWDVNRRIVDGLCERDQDLPAKQPYSLPLLLGRGCPQLRPRTTDGPIYALPACRLALRDRTWIGNAAGCGGDRASEELPDILPALGVASKILLPMVVPLPQASVRVRIWYARRCTEASTIRDCRAP